MIGTVYLQVGGYPFINYDDDRYVTENPRVLAGLSLEGVRWAFTSTAVSNWHPLTWVSHMLDVSLFGPDPGMHHLSSVALHGANSVLLFFVLCGMTGAAWRSFAVAALFAVHPLHVESVAWVAERKDVLSALFWLLSMAMYRRYGSLGGRGRYALTVLFFVLGLLSKPMVVTLPFVFLLLDWWPLGRVAGGPPPASGLPARAAPAGRLVLEKVPLLALSLASCAVTYAAQGRGGSFSEYPFGVRLENAAVSYGAYLWKTVWPSSLAVFYPHPGDSPGGIPSWQVAASLLFLALATAGALLRGRSRPYLPVGWFWYLGTLVPVIGLVQVGGQGMADRYTYVPLIGAFILAAWGLPDALAGWRHRARALGAALAAVLLALSVVSREQVGRWRDDFTLFGHALSVTSGNWQAHNNYGYAHFRRGDVERAIAHYREALRIAPTMVVALSNLGFALHGLGRYDEAIAVFREALRIAPGHAEARHNLGVSLIRGEKSLAEAHFNLAEALRVKPDYVEAYYNMGNCLVRMGRREEAVAYYREAVRRRPGYADALNNLGIVLVGLGRVTEGIAAFEEAVRANPADPVAGRNLGAALGMLGRTSPAPEN